MLTWVLCRAFYIFQKKKQVSAQHCMEKQKIILKVFTGALKIDINVCILFIHARYINARLMSVQYKGENVS